MPNLSGVEGQLRKERDRAWSEMERLIAALAGLGSLGILGDKVEPSGSVDLVHQVKAGLREHDRRVTVEAVCDNGAGFHTHDRAMHQSSATRAPIRSTALRFINSIFLPTFQRRISGRPSFTIIGRARCRSLTLSSSLVQVMEVNSKHVQNRDIVVACRPSRRLGSPLDAEK